jgi:heme-degrading monooxygenase HmoA
MDDTKPFAALVIYPTTPGAQHGQAETLLRIARTTISSMPGFISGRVYLSEDGEQIISLVEWRDRESFLNFRQSDFGRAATQVIGELHPVPYWLTRLAAVDPAS